MGKKERKIEFFGFSQPVWGPEFNTKTGKLIQA